MIHSDSAPKGGSLYTYTWSFTGARFEVSQITLHGCSAGHLGSMQARYASPVGSTQELVIANLPGCEVAQVQEHRRRRGKNNARGCGKSHSEVPRGCDRLLCT